MAGWIVPPSMESVSFSIIPLISFVFLSFYFPQEYLQMLSSWRLFISTRMLALKAESCWGLDFLILRPPSLVIFRLPHSTVESGSILHSRRFTKMVQDYRPSVIWAVTETDSDMPQPQDHTIFFNSGKRLLQKLAFGLVPSFVQRKARQAPSKANRLHPTSYLDGLRGMASFIVFLGHYTEETLGWYSEPYGFYEDRAPSSPLQLPFVRVLYSPRPMVHIFFIISGYVLSYKPLKQIHYQQLSALTTTLSSSVFRRALRLFLPSIITMLIMALTVHFEISDDRFAPSFYTLSDQISHWW